MRRGRRLTEKAGTEGASGPLAPGFFGKLPSVGDFVCRGLPPGFVAAWDGWVSRGLAAAPGVPAEAMARMWGFRLGVGVPGAGPACGVFRLSADRVGRVFPLVAAQVGGATPAAGDPWFAALGGLLSEAVETSMRPDALAARLADLGAPVAGDADGGEGEAWRLDAPGRDPHPLDGLHGDGFARLLRAQG